MKRIILITLSAISLWACDKQHKKTDAEEWGLKGKVKSVKQTTYAAVEHLGKVRKGWNIDYEDLFLKEITANYYKVFDEKGNQIEGDWYDLYGNVLYKDTYAYDEKGNQTEEVRYKSDGKIDVKFTFDDRGNQIERVLYKSDGSVRSKKIYAYDEKGNRIEEVWYDSDGNIEGKVTFMYDEKGNKIEDVSFIYSPFYKSKYMVFSKWTYAYDNKGNQIEWVIYRSDDNIDGKVTFAYDDKGNSIEVVDYESDGSMRDKRTLTYEYDAHDNWIKKITYKNGKAESIAEREITYYE